MKRTNTAVWSDKKKLWQINVQKDGKRRSFYSSKPGRTGQREANAKADAWLDKGIENENLRVHVLFEAYIEDLKTRTSKSHWRMELSRWTTWIKPQIGTLKASKLSDYHLQQVINAGYQGGLSKKSLQDLRATLTSFVKYCRKRKTTQYHPEEILIPKGAVSQKRESSSRKTWCGFLRLIRQRYAANVLESH